MSNGHQVRKVAHVCLGVCTFQRPQMLMHCLMSLQRLPKPEGTRVSIVIVDNETSDGTLAIVEKWATGQDRQITYVAEPRRGISHARNAILNTATEFNADWIAMLDDDMVVPPDWLDNMWTGAKVGADVVQSTVRRKLPEALLTLALPEPARKQEWQHNRRHAQTCGILFLGSLSNFVFSPIAALLHRRCGRARLLKAMKQMGKASGIVVGLTGAVRPEPYRTVHGH